MSESRRLKRIMVSPQVLGHMFTADGTLWECIEGLPVGSKFKGVYLNEKVLMLVLAFEHESFDEVPEGDVVPLHSCAFNSRLSTDPNPGPTDERYDLRNRLPLDHP